MPGAWSKEQGDGRRPACPRWFISLAGKKGSDQQISACCLPHAPCS